MAILAECPLCHKKQSVKNKACKCGADMDKFKRQKKRVRYWIDFKIPGGKKRREAVGFSIEEARDADGKRRTQKRENRIFDMLPESNMTFIDLTAWYLDLKTVKKLSSFDRVRLALDNFNKEYGNRIVGTIKPVDFENYQEKRGERGLAPATIDMEISITKTMVTKAFDNDLVDGRVIKAFRAVKRKLKKGANARKRTISFDEYLRLLKSAAFHLKYMIIVAFNTGMRLGELRKLKWSYIDRKAGVISLPEGVTKEKKPKIVPINHHVNRVFNEIPRALKHDFVFTHEGQRIKSKNGIKRSFRTACKNSGIPCGRKIPDGIIFHDFRRTVKTNMLNAGIDKVHRDTILGHSLEGMDVHYLVPGEEVLKQKMGEYTRWLDEQLASVKANQEGKVDSE